MLQTVVKFPSSPNLIIIKGLLELKSKPLTIATSLPLKENKNNKQLIR